MMRKQPAIAKLLRDEGWQKKKLQNTQESIQKKDYLEVTRNPFLF